MAMVFLKKSSLSERHSAWDIYALHQTLPVRDINAHNSELSRLPGMLEARRLPRFSRLLRPFARSSSVLTIMWLIRFRSRRICFRSSYGMSGMTYASTLVNSSTKFYKYQTYICLYGRIANGDTSDNYVSAVNSNFWPVELPLVLHCLQYENKLHR